MIKKHAAQVHIGTSGFSYPHWKENFYPADLNTKEWLKYYAQVFSTVELNTTFYHLPLISTVQNWDAQVTEHFLFSIKASRYITHQKRLHECRESLHMFYKRMQGFGPKMGPILFQLPPSFHINKERLLEFIRHLDHAYLHVFEFRHPSWFVDEIYDILKENQIALCITDLNGKLSPEELTTHFTYIRLHGPKKAYQGTYGSQLKTWQHKIEQWSLNASVFCYFDNDEKGYAIQDAKTLQEMFRL